MLDGISDIGPSQCEIYNAPARVQYRVQMSMGAPKSALSLAEMSTGVEQGLQDVIPARCKMLHVYDAYVKNRICVSLVVVMPKK